MRQTQVLRRSAARVWLNTIVEMRGHLGRRWLSTDPNVRHVALGQRRRAETIQRRSVIGDGRESISELRIARSSRHRSTGEHRYERFKRVGTPNREADPAGKGEFVMKYLAIGRIDRVEVKTRRAEAIAAHLRRLSSGQTPNDRR